MFKKIIGLLGYILMIVGPIIGCWVSLADFFCGGLIQMLTGIFALNIEMAVIGPCKFIFFWFPGSVIALVAVLIACLMIIWGEDGL